jgi:hypothetical protein
LKTLKWKVQISQEILTLTSFRFLTDAKSMISRSTHCFDKSVFSCNALPRLESASSRFGGIATELCARRREQLGTPICAVARVYPWWIEYEGRCLAALLDITVSLQCSSIIATWEQVFNLRRWRPRSTSAAPRCAHRWLNYPFFHVRARSHVTLRAPSRQLNCVPFPNGWERLALFNLLCCDVVGAL